MVNMQKDWRKRVRWDIYESRSGKVKHLTHCYAYNSGEAEKKARSRFKNIKSVSRLISSRDIVLNR